MAQGYDIDGIEPGHGAGGGGYDYDEVVLGPGALAVNALYGWSLENNNVGLSTVYIRFGDQATDAPWIAINLAENETVTQIFPDGIPAPANGFYVTVEAGDISGILYTG